MYWTGSQSWHSFSIPTSFAKLGWSEQQAVNSLSQNQLNRDLILHFWMKSSPLCPLDRLDSAVPWGNRHLYATVRRYQLWRSARLGGMHYSRLSKSSIKLIVDIGRLSLLEKYRTTWRVETRPSFSLPSSTCRASLGTWGELRKGCRSRYSSSKILLWTNIVG